MGLARAPDTQNKLDTIEKMREWKTWERKSDGKSYVECNAVGMTVDPSELG